LQRSKRRSRPRKSKVTEPGTELALTRLHGGPRSLGRTPPLEELLDLLRRAAPHARKGDRGRYLPPAAWKRLFLTALRRMASHGQSSLAQLCALEAISLPLFPPPSWAKADPPGRRFSRLRVLSGHLRQLEERRVSKGDLKPISWPEPIHMHLVYRRAFGLFNDDAADSEFVAVWGEWAQEGWLRGKDVHGALERARMGRASRARALVFTAEALGYGDASSLEQIFQRHGLTTNMEKFGRANT
jgi:hypothetical protein